MEEVGGEMALSFRPYPSASGEFSNFVRQHIIAFSEFYPLGKGRGRSFEQT